MKKTFLYVCVVAMLAVVFSSCLGNNESTTSNSNVFSVIQKNDAGTLFAPIIINNALANITGEGLAESSVGDAVLISYKVNFDNWISSSLLKADYIAVNEKFPLPHKDIQNQPMDTTVNNSPFKSVSIRGYDTQGYLLNRWLFEFAAEVQGDQNIDVVYFYNKDSQKDQEGKDLPKDTYIIDITLVKTGVAGEGVSKTTKNKSIVLNFTNFRKEHKPSEIGTNGVSLNIWFRYIYINTSSKKDLNYWKPGIPLFFPAE